jgi:hypothetical protein
MSGPLTPTHARGRRVVRLIGCGLTLGGLALSVGCAADANARRTSTAPASDAVTVIVPDGVETHHVHHPLPAQCASGCDAVPPAMLMTLDDAQLDALLAEVQAAPVREESDALHQLLFYADQTRLRLEDTTAPLDAPHVAWLREELAVTRAEIAMRVRDEAGVVKASLPAREVPLGKKQHLSLEAPGYGALVASGTLLRVSTYYVWTRV